MSTEMDFEQRVRDGYYNNNTSTFMNDLTLWLRTIGVPDQYARKVAYYAWDQGHAYGYHEVFNYAQNLAEIFS